MSIYDKSSLVLIPSGTKTGKVYSQKPVSGDGDFTFTRSSAATRVNADGFIEKETQNLLLQSNTFSNAVWVDNAGTCTRTSGQSGYDGTTDAWLLTQDTAGYDNIIQSVSSSGVNTYSIYAKGSSTAFTLRIANTGDRVLFNLSTGSVASTFGSNLVDYGMTDVGGGWYRCYLTANATITDLNIYPYFNSTTATSVTIQDAQLEQGLVARDYIETTTTAVEGGITDNVPRLDYTDSSCPALLLEPQRTNLVTQSEYFGDSSWSKTSSGSGSNAIVTDNYGTSPEGIQNASRLQLNLNGGTSGSDISYIAYYYTATGVTTTNSIYMKSLSGTSNVRIRCGSTFKSVDVTTDWQRFDVTDSSTSDRLQVLIYGGINSDTADLLVYAAQAEAGSYATSYIPTYGSSVTRVVDSCLATSVSDLIGQTQGAFFAEFKIENLENLATRRLLTLSDGTSNTRMVVYLNSLNKISIYIVDGGVAQWDYTGTILTEGTYKIAVGYAANDFVLYLNGSVEASDSSGSVPATNRIDIGSQLGSNVGEQPIKQLSVFKTRLTNAELADLTTL